MTETVTIVDFIRQDGSICIFATDDGRGVGVDHGPAEYLLHILDEDGEVEAEVEGWQFLLILPA